MTGTVALSTTTPTATAIIPSASGTPDASITTTAAAASTPVIALTIPPTGTAIPVVPVSTVLSSATAALTAVVTEAPSSITATLLAGAATPSAIPPSTTPLASDTVTATVAPTTTGAATTSTVATLNAAPAVTGPGLAQSYGRLPLSFEPNRGQTDPAVRFMARAPGLTLYLTGTDATLVLTKPRPHARAHRARRLVLDGTHALSDTVDLTGTAPISASVVRLHYVGANPTPLIEGQDQLPGVANYFTGRDPTGWHTDIPTYARTAYKDVYPGINLVYYGNQSRLEYDWQVAPGVDPRAISFEVQGAQGLHVDGQGNLVVTTTVGALQQRAPTVYQDIAGQQRLVPTRYRLTDSGDGSGPRTVGFDVGSYDPSRPLVIDPVLAYSTYLGGSSYDGGSGIAVDRAGQAYVVGTTVSTNFPTAAPEQGSFAGGTYDTFVSKLAPGGSALLYSTYLGGNNDDQGRGIAIDPSGDAYVTGSTLSTNFPTVNAFQSAPGGNTCYGGAPCYDAFVTKLAPRGNALLYSTYLGGSDDDV